MKVVATEKAPKALGPYSQGYVHAGVLYTAGQIAIDPAVNDVTATTIEEQTEQVCKNLGEVLKEAGAEEVFQEKFTGTNVERPQFNLVFKKLKDGDTLIVTK